MFIQQDISFINDSEKATNLIVAANNFYNSIKIAFGKIRGTILALVIGIPLILLIWCFLAIIVWRLQKRLNAQIDITLTNYKDLKNDQYRLNKIAKSLSEMKTINMHKIPFVLRGIMRKIRKLSILVNQYRTSLNLAINNLNVVSDNGLFKPIKEDDLWINRTKVYDYIA